MLIDKDMKKKDLCVAAGISHASMGKLGKNENITTDVLVKICNAILEILWKWCLKRLIERMQSDER